MAATAQPTASDNPGASAPNITGQNMEQIKVTTLRKAMTLLNACGFQYAILDSDGVVHGTLEVTTPKPRKSRANLAFNYGEISDYVSAHMPADIAVGDVIEVPFLAYGKERVRSGALNVLRRKYGTNKFTSVIEGKNVQLMRVEE
jgi:hypothetical protein